MIDIATLSLPDFEIFNRVVSQFEDASKAGKPSQFDIDTELESVQNPFLEQAIRDEIKYQKAYFASREIMIAGGRKRFGKYDATEHIATGGFGVVFRGRGPSGNDVAIKVAHFTTLVGRTKEDIETEAKLLQELSHENIVEYIDSGWTATGDWYLVTEWLDGVTMADAINDFEHGIGEALSTITNVAAGISWGHNQDIIHRDIKPRNIMLAQDGEHAGFKILDYGLSKQTASEMTRTTNIRGTHNYMAPEQHDGYSDERSDIYAMGRVMREILRKRYPDRNTIPRTVRRIIEKATAQDPSNRYQTALDFQDAVDDAYRHWTAGDVPDFDPPLVTKTRAAFVTLAVVAVAIFALLRPAPPPTFDPTAPVASYFNSNGEARMILETSPPTAEIFVYPLRNGKGPDKADEIFVGTGRGSAWLESLDYLVVVIWPDGEFTETIRRVPIPAETEQPLNCVISFRKNENGLRMATIKKPDEISQHPTHNEPTSWQSACEILEPQGKRLPFLSEVTPIEAGCQWTANRSSFVAWNRNNLVTQVCKYFMVAPGGAVQLTFEHNFRVYFKGVRPSVPFGR